jgi:prepilin-type N-terminal cleavage/methylation domain-containing protein
MNKKHAAAFTLIELLVVLVIISLVVTTATLSSLNTSTLQAKQTAKMIYALLGLTQQQAVLQPALFAFQINKGGYTFLRYQLKNNNLQGGWIPVQNNSFLHFYYFPKKVLVQLTLLNSGNQPSLINANQNEDMSMKKVAAPMIIFFNNGDFTPFVLNIGVWQKPPIYKIIGYENGVISLVNMQS